jgi:hypothetical protein
MTTASIRAACTRPDLAISCYVISGLHYFYKSKKKKKRKIIFDTRDAFFIPGIKAQRDEGDGKIMLCCNTDSRVVMLGQVPLCWDL